MRWLAKERLRAEAHAFESSWQGRMSHHQYLNIGEVSGIHQVQEDISYQKVNFPLHYLAEWFDGGVQHRQWFMELLAEGYSLETQDNFGCTVLYYIQNKPDLVACVEAYLSVGALEDVARKAEKAVPRRHL